MRWPFASTYERTWRRSVHATCAALYPPDPGGAPDAERTDLANRTLRYVQTLPPTHRFLLPLLFFGVDVLPLLLAPWAGRLSRRTPEEIRAIVTRWRGSAWMPLRGLGDALRTTLQMMYLSHPAVLTHLGEYKTVAYPDDPFVVPIHASLLAAPQEVA